MHGATSQESSAIFRFTCIPFRCWKSWLSLMMRLRWNGLNGRCGRRSGISKLLKLLGELGHLRHQRLDRPTSVGDRLLLLIHSRDAHGGEVIPARSACCIHNVVRSFCYGTTKAGCNCKERYLLSQKVRKVQTHREHNTEEWSSGHQRRMRGDAGTSVDNW
jgi:hypothetical protein